MNRILLMGNVVLLGVVVLLSGLLFSPSHAAKPGGTTRPFNDMEAGGMTAADGGMAYPGPGTYCTDCANDSFAGLNIQEFMTGVARYRFTHSAVIDKEPYMTNKTIEDARACWYPLDTLEKYFCLVKKYSSKLNIPLNSLGIRLYYAVYPSEPAGLRDPKYISHHTLYLVPTYDDKVLGHVDFDPHVSTAPLTTYFAGTHKRRMMIFDLGDQQNKQNELQQLSRNQGQLCPPNCPPPPSTLATIDQTYPRMGYQQ